MLAGFAMETHPPKTTELAQSLRGELPCYVYRVVLGMEESVFFMTGESERWKKVTLASAEAVGQEDLINALQSYRGAVTLVLGHDLQVSPLALKLMAERSATASEGELQCDRLSICKKKLELQLRVGSLALWRLESLIKPSQGGLKSARFSTAEAIEALLREAKPMRLDVWGCKITKSKAERLTRALLCVEEMRFAFATFTSSGLKTLVNALPGTQLRKLHWRWGAATSADIWRLATVLAATNLQVLDLSFMKFGSSGVEALAQALPESQLQSLSLHGVDMDDLGAEALTRVLKRCSLTKLSISGNNKVTRAAAESLKAALEAEKDRLLVLQLDAKPEKDEARLVFRTMGGTEATAFKWDLGKRAAHLVSEIHSKVRVAGALKVVMPNGQLLSSSECRRLKRSLKFGKEPRPSKKPRTDY